MSMDKQLNDTASLKVRNTNIEVFRLLLMLSIFCWHILMHGAGLKNMSDGYVNNFVYKAFLCAFFAPATYCFMFVSGFYGINFSLSKLGKLELSLIIVSLLCSFIVYFLGGQALRIYLGSLFPISSCRWWFITYYVIIYLLSPIINKGISNINKKQFTYLLCGLIIYNTLSIVRLLDNGGSNFLGLLTIFLIARYFKIYSILLSKKIVVFIYLFSGLLLTLLLVLANSYCPVLTFKLLNYNTPLIMLMAISSSLFFIKLKPLYNKKINKILSSCLYIYLFTDGLGVLFYKFVQSCFINSYLMGVAVVVMSIIVCLLMGLFIDRLSEVLLRRIGKSMFWQNMSRVFV